MKRENKIKSTVNNLDNGGFKMNIRKKHGHKGRVNY